MAFLNCVFYLAGVGAAGFVVGRMIPGCLIRENWFPYRIRASEKGGTVYEKLGIQHWQNKVPDMSRILPRLIPPKKLVGDLEARLPLMIRETCVAELIHLALNVASLYCLRLWEGAGGVWITILYQIGNMPYILIQRYNRPKLIRIRERLAEKTARQYAMTENPV